jgi:hypothetical protein
MDFLKGRSCTDVVRHEYAWAFVFGADCGLNVECPWRVIADGRIAVAHSDHGQKFGLLQPVDVPAETLRLLSGHPIVGTSVKSGSSDLCLKFEGDRRLELFTDSSGYESWQLSGPDGRLWVGRND